jgi:hypothetical protein
MAINVKKENWVFVENQNGKDYYINTIPKKNMVYIIGEKQDEKIVPIKGDNLQYLPLVYQVIIRKYKKEYIESKKVETAKRAEINKYRGL